MSIHVLLVEDSLSDVRLTQEVFINCPIPVQLHVVEDGIAALQYLRREGGFRQAVGPDLILLDLNLPKLDGRKVLAVIKKDAELKSIPVVVLTNSDAASDVEMSYELQVNCYLKKPAEWDAFSRVVKSVIDFWLIKAKLPSEEQRQAMISTFVRD